MSKRNLSTEATIAIKRGAAQFFRDEMDYWRGVDDTKSSEYQRCLRAVQVEIALLEREQRERFGALEAEVVT